MRKPDQALNVPVRRAFYLTVLSSAAALLLPFSSAVLAQEAESGSALEEVIVTATKREQSLEEIPFSIQAFSGELLDDANIRDTSELINFVPGASEGFSNTVGQRRYQIRGIEQGSGSPTIGYYIGDAANFGVAFAPIGRAFDMERVEVLRGPQGTLYGNGAMGGVIRFIPNEPNLEKTDASVRVGYSFTDGGDPNYFADGALSLPIVEDVLGLRLVASKEEVGGYQESGISGASNIDEATLTNFRASLLWRPTEQLAIKFLYVKNQADQVGGTLLASLDPPVADTFPGDFNNIESDLYSGTVEYDFEFAALSTTTTYSKSSPALRFGLSFPLAPGGVLELNSGSENKVLTNETRLISQNDGAFQWLIGTFYSDTENAAAFSFVPEIPAFGFVNGPPLKSTSNSMSYFGEAFWELMGGKLVPLLGVRYFEEEFEGDTVVAAGFPGGKKFDNTSFRFNLSWLPSENVNYYLNIAEGFRSGGFNSVTVCNVHVLAGGLPCQLAVGSDELTSYEIGSKLAIADGQLSLDSALYFQDWKGVRQNVTFAIGADYAVGDAAVYGIDLGLSYAPAAVEGLTLDLSANWNSAEFTEIAPALELATGVQKGDRISFVPEWTLAFSAGYTWNIANGWTGVSFLAYNHIAPQLGQFSDGIAGDSRDLVRASIGAEKDKFGVYLVGKNLLGENGAIYSQRPLGGVQLYTQDLPRQVGVEFKYDF